MILIVYKNSAREGMIHLFPSIITLERHNSSTSSGIGVKLLISKLTK